MSEKGGRPRRTSARLSQNGSSSTQYNGKRSYTTSQSTSTSTTTTKRRKVESKSKSKEDKLVDVMVDFNLAVNELFHLQEYKSLLSWDPVENSRSNHKPVKADFENFINENKYKLTWDEEIENSTDITNLPLRFQKKKLADQHKLLDEKFPFREEVLSITNEVEEQLFDKLETVPQHTTKPSHKPTPKPKSKPISQKKGRTEPSVVLDSDGEEVESEEVEEEQEQEQEVEEDNESIASEQPDSDEDLPEPDVIYRIKSIKKTIPASIVTHPSHIPSWRPEQQQQQQQTSESIHVHSADEGKIIKYDPTPLTIFQTKEDTIIAPELTVKLRNYLDNEYKTPIIDESNMPDYNFSAEEYNTIMSQQTELFQKIRHKINVEKSLELNDDKIEQRKVILPPSNIKLTDPFRNTSSVTPRIQGVATNATHQDHLLAQGIAFSKLHQQMRRQHQLRTRKVASMIDQHFKKKRGEKERLAKEREQNLKKMSRLTMQAVKKRWNQAYKVYQIVQHEKEEELKKIKGRQHLSEMLEHSTQLLEAQLTSSREATADVESESSDAESVDSDEFISSDEDDEPVKLNGHDNDLNLSVEELRKKYANIDNELSSSNVASASDDNDDDIDVSRGLASLYGIDQEFQSPSPSLDYTEDEKKLINNESDSAMNSILDSDSVSSIEDSESSSEEEEEEEHEEVTQNGLASLFTDNIADSDDEDVEMEDEEEEEGDSDDNMSTSDSETELNGKVVENGTKSDTDISKDDEDDDDDDNVDVVNGAKVKDVPLPSLLRGTLRPYQKQGLNWLASLYNNNTNGILADEMGLGKTIQTISLLAYLACEHHIWGPHLIIVPTSVMLNWEMEFKKFAPGFKVLTYYGSPQQRAQKRKGWNKPDAFHVCITSYQLVVQDQESFKRRRWRYMILDEAHNIKNFRSTRWRALLNFNTENRLLLTGTPLQNNLMELWSLLYFLMPSSKVNQAMPEGFANLDDFQQWFGKPVDKIMEKTTTGNNADLIDENATQKMDEETRNTVARLHQVLRPYLLRRLKKDVEKQMPGKYEHIVYCRLSKRQRFLYDDFMSRAKTKETLASGNFLSIINCLMQLRKVCNHPDLFEVRPIVTSFAMPRSIPSFYQQTNQLIRKQFDMGGDIIDFNILNLDVTSSENLNYFVCQSSAKLKSSQPIQEQIDKLTELENGLGKADPTDIVSYYQHLKLEDQIEVKEKLQQVLYLNSLRCERKPIYGESLLKMLRLNHKPLEKYSLTLSQRVSQLDDIIEKYSIITPAVVALDMKEQLVPVSTRRKVLNEVTENPFHKSQVKLSIAFPDKTLLQYDCGKLQKLATLLHDLISNGHRALIFTQMTKVLDILEYWLNVRGYKYLRLDGSTKIEDRQIITHKFNHSNIPVFILSTRSGGLGINLTGADTVIFYDSDWNPSIDAQAQDRAHRIGQMRDVHIYRLISEATIESNIIRVSNQKRKLDNLVIQAGQFNTDFLGTLVKDTKLLAQVEDEEDRVAAGVALREEVDIDNVDFKEETATAEDQQQQEVEEDEEAGHIDDYMLRFIAAGYYV